MSLGVMGNPIVTFQIERRINAEVFIEWNVSLIIGFESSVRGWQESASFDHLLG